jgi:hypothetical protein
LTVIGALSFMAAVIAVRRMRTAAVLESDYRHSDFISAEAVRDSKVASWICTGRAACRKPRELRDGRSRYRVSQERIPGSTESRAVRSCIEATAATTRRQHRMFLSASRSGVMTPGSGVFGLFMGVCEQPQRSAFRSGIPHVLRTFERSSEMRFFQLGNRRSIP